MDVFLLRVILLVNMNNGICPEIVPAKTGDQKCSEQHNEQELTNMLQARGSKKYGRSKDMHNMPALFGNNRGFFSKQGA